MSEKSAIVAEIEREITSRYRYSKFDFVLNHLLLFMVVIASSYPAFAQIFGDGQTKLSAGIAAIPAFILLFQRTFKWEQRGEWHWDYRRRLIAILREVRDQGLSDSEASKKLNLLEEELAGSFPGVNYPASKEK